ncbi:MAG: hypothetical protein AAGB22_15555, partial [Bacteroidota bacterium]
SRPTGSYYNKNYKIALPDLEVGDIIDYYEYQDYTESSFSFKGFTTFKTNTLTLVSIFPILQQEYEFYLKKKTYFIFSPLNGAPRPDIQDVTSDDAAGLRRKILFRIDEPQDAIRDDDNWVYGNLVYPVIRYQIGIGQGSAAQLKEVFFDKEDKATSERSKSDILAMIRDRTMPASKGGLSKNGKLMYKGLSKYMKTNQTGDPEVDMRLAYNFLRHKYTRARASALSGEISAIEITATYSYFLTANGIKHDVFHATRRHVCRLEDVLARSDLMFGLKIYTDKVDYVVFGFRNYRFGELPWSLLGVDAYVYNVHPTGFNSETYEVEKLPVNNAPDNYTHTNIRLRLDGDKL